MTSSAPTPSVLKHLTARMTGWVNIQRSPPQPAPPPSSQPIAVAGAAGSPGQDEPPFPSTATAAVAESRPAAGSVGSLDQLRENNNNSSDSRHSSSGDDSGSENQQQPQQQTSSSAPSPAAAFPPAPTSAPPSRRPSPTKRFADARDIEGLPTHGSKQPYRTTLNTLFTLPEPQIIGPYVLGNEVGKGSYGVVRVATHIPTNQQVAIKIMEKSYAPLVVREVDAWRHLRHNHIAQLYEVIVTENKIYLVMEYARSGELFDYIVQRGHLREREARRIFTQLVHAVGYTHSKGFVHRDLKPENLLLDSNLSLKLVDFGFTKKFEPGKLMGSFCGSVAYAAPELIQKEKYSGPETDVWSLGVILYALLVGRLPFDDPNGNDKEIFRKVLAVDYEVDERISAPAQDLISKILQRNPKQRLTIAEILSHEWLTFSSSSAVGDGQNGPEISSSESIAESFVGESSDFDNVGTSETDQQVLKVMSALGIDTKHLIASLHDHVPDCVSAMFFMFRRKFAANALTVHDSTPLPFPLSSGGGVNDGSTGQLRSVKPAPQPIVTVEASPVGATTAPRPLISIASTSTSAARAKTPTSSFAPLAAAPSSSSSTPSPPSNQHTGSGSSNSSTPRRIVQVVPSGRRPSLSSTRALAVVSEEDESTSGGPVSTTTPSTRHQSSFKRSQAQRGPPVAPVEISIERVEPLKCGDGGAPLGTSVLPEASSNSIASMLTISSPTSASTQPVTPTVDADALLSSASYFATSSISSSLATAIADPLPLPPGLVLAHAPPTSSLNNTVAVALSPSSASAADLLIEEAIVATTSAAPATATVVEQSGVFRMDMESPDSTSSLIEKRRSSLSNTVDASDSDDELREPVLRSSNNRTTMRLRSTTSHATAEPVRAQLSAPIISPGVNAAPATRTNRHTQAVLMPLRRFSLETRKRPVIEEDEDDGSRSHSSGLSNTVHSSDGNTTTTHARPSPAGGAAAGAASGDAAAIAASQRWRKKSDATESAAKFLLLRNQHREDADASLRKVRDGVFGVSTTSTRDSNFIIKELLRVFRTNRVPCERVDDYRFVIDCSLPQPEHVKDAEALSAHLTGGHSNRPLSASFHQPPAAVGNGKDHHYEASVALPAMMNQFDVFNQIKFEIEVCILADNLRGIRLKRLQGDTWIYKSLCKAILDELHI